MVAFFYFIVWLFLVRILLCSSLAKYNPYYPNPKTNVL
jgi:hypothetical protein